MVTEHKTPFAPSSGVDAAAVEARAATMGDATRRVKWPLVIAGVLWLAWVVFLAMMLASRFAP